MKAFLLGLIVLLPAQLANAATCESLANLKLLDTTITIAQTVAAGAFTPPAVPGGRGGGGGPQTNAYRGLPAFCRVEATVKPSSDSDIKIEVWLPVSGWNTKFEAVGNGGWTGNIPYAALAAGVQRGYATAATVNRHLGIGTKRSHTAWF